jgi:hypothetical protein
MRGLIFIEITLTLMLFTCMMLGYSWQAVVLSLCIYLIYILFKMEDRRRIFLSLLLWLVWSVVIFYVAHYIYHV